jgi:hypothetical protein
MAVPPHHAKNDTAGMQLVLEPCKEEGRQRWWDGFMHNVMFAEGWVNTRVMCATNKGTSNGEEHRVYVCAG